MIALPADFLEDNTSEFLGSVLCFWCRHNQDSMKKNLPRDVMLRFRPRSPIETLNLYLTKLAGPTPYTYTSCSCSLSLWAFQCSVGRCHCGGRIINILACASSKKRKKKKKKKVYSHNVLSVGEAKLLGAFSWRPTLPALFEFQLADSDPVAEL